MCLHKLALDRWIGTVSLFNVRYVEQTYDYINFYLNDNSSHIH